MSEKYKKTYISAKEFVSSWEKEIYELTNLDYFIYLLINELGSRLEHDFFPQIDDEDLFYLKNEEIAAISFNIGDGLQLFLDKNCFNGCSLGCPNKLNKPFSRQEDQIRIDFVTTEFDGLTASCTNREDCLYHDVMNYVVLDALLDFYNYEMGVILHEKDRKLNKLATFIMEYVIQFIYRNGEKLLSNPNETATELFSRDLQRDEELWEEMLPDPDNDETDDADSWKVNHISVEVIFNSFEEEHGHLLNNLFSQKLFGNFRKFLNEYLEVNRLDELEFEYIEEFFLLLLPQDFLMDTVDFNELRVLFSALFEFIDQQVGTDLKENFDTFKTYELTEVERTLLITQKYQNKNPYINFLLSKEASKNELEEGYFEIIEKNDDRIILRDVDLKNTYDNIDLGFLENEQIKLGDILHVQLNTDGNRWRLVFLELIFPASSKYFLY